MSRAVEGLRPASAVRLKAKVVREWHRHVRRLSRLHGPVEALRGHPDDGRRNPVDRDGLTENVGTSAEAAIPIPEGDHGNRRRGPLVVIAAERAAERRRDAKSAVIGAGHHLCGNRDFRLPVDKDVDLREGREGEEI